MQARKDRWMGRYYDLCDFVAKRKSQEGRSDDDWPLRIVHHYRDGLVFDEDGNSLKDSDEHKLAQWVQNQQNELIRGPGRNNKMNSPEQRAKYMYRVHLLRELDGFPRADEFG